MLEVLLRGTRVLRTEQQVDYLVEQYPSHFVKFTKNRFGLIERESPVGVKPRHYAEGEFEEEHRGYLTEEQMREIKSLPKENHLYLADADDLGKLAVQEKEIVVGLLNKGNYPILAVE